MVRRWRLREAPRFLRKVLFQWHLTEIPHIWLPFCFLKLLVAHPAVSFVGLLGDGREVWFLGRAGVAAGMMCFMGSLLPHVCSSALPLLSSVLLVFLESERCPSSIIICCHWPRSSDDSVDTGIKGMFCTTLSCNFTR